jgi:hypothetical protein
MCPEPLVGAAAVPWRQSRRAATATLPVAVYPVLARPLSDQMSVAKVAIFETMGGGRYRLYEGKAEWSGPAQEKHRNVWRSPDSARGKSGLSPSCYSHPSQHLVEASTAAAMQSSICTPRYYVQSQPPRWTCLNDVTRLTSRNLPHASALPTQHSTMPLNTHAPTTASREISKTSWPLN